MRETSRKVVQWVLEQQGWKLPAAQKHSDLLVYQYEERRILDWRFRTCEGCKFMSDPHCPFFPGDNERILILHQQQAVYDDKECHARQAAIPSSS